MRQEEAKNVVIIDNGDMSGSITSDVIELYGPYCLIIEATGSPVGSLSLQVSDDQESFVEYGSQSINGARSWPYNTPDCIYKFIKLIWTPTSGTGTLNIRCRTFNY